jgi:hypothetical protein
MKAAGHLQRPTTCFLHSSLPVWRCWCDGKLHQRFHRIALAGRLQYFVGVQEESQHSDNLMC